MSTTWEARWPRSSRGGRWPVACLMAHLPAVAPASGECTTLPLAPTDPFPREAVRDLLGITRALYRAERAKVSPDPSRMARLLEIGKQYRLGLDLGVKYEPDTMAGRAAKS